MWIKQLKLPIDYGWFKIISKNVNKTIKITHRLCDYP